MTSPMAFRTLLILFAFLLGASSVSAQWWNPFVTRPSRLAPTEQTERSAELFREALLDVERGRNRSAERKFRHIFRRYPLSDYSAQSLHTYGRLTFQRRQWRKSFEAFQTLLSRHPEFPRFNEVIAYQFDIALALAEGTGVRWLGIIPYRAFNRSVAYFEVVVRNAPFSDFAPLALMNVARIHERRGNIPEAIDALDRLINNYPSSLLASDAYLALAETFSELVSGPLYDQGATREAMSYFQDFLILFPQDEGVARAEEGLEAMREIYARSRLVIGKYYFRHRNWYRAAEIFFNETITIAPLSEPARQARLYLERIEEFRQRALEDPNFRPPVNTWGDRIFFWRARATDINLDVVEDDTVTEPGVRMIDDAGALPLTAPD